MPLRKFGGGSSESEDRDYMPELPDEMPESLKKLLRAIRKGDVPKEVAKDFISAGLSSTIDGLLEQARRAMMEEKRDKKVGKEWDGLIDMVNTTFRLGDEHRAVTMLIIRMLFLLAGAVRTIEDEQGKTGITIDPQAWDYRLQSPLDPPDK